MGRGRFALLLTVLAMAVGAGSFATSLQVLDDGQPDPPPRVDAGVATDTTAPPGDAGTTTSTPVASTTPPGGLATPTWVVVVASEGSEGAAQEAAGIVAAKGYPAGVLDSDDHASLNPGLWVAYAGPYPDGEAATDAVDDLAADGVPGTYVRCVGSKKECRGSEERDDRGSSDEGEGD